MVLALMPATVFADDSDPIIGDVTMDGEVWIEDVKLLQEYLEGSIDSNELDLAAADFNQDGRVDSDDLKALQRYLLIEQGTTWLYTVQYDGGAEFDRQVDYKTNGKDLTLLGETFKRNGYVQTGWVDNSGNEYELGGIYATNADVTLYPVWDEIVTFEVPFTTTVKQDGNVALGETVFNLQVIGSDGDKISSGDVEIEANPVTTNGVGTYEGTMTITGTNEDISRMLSDKVFVKQADVDDPNWTVDDKVWGLMPGEVAASLSTDGTTPSNSVFIFPAEYYETENGGYYEIIR